MISDGTRACFNGLCDRLREELQRNPHVHDVLSVELQEAGWNCRRQLPCITCT